MSAERADGWYFVKWYDGGPWEVAQCKDGLIYSGMHGWVKSSLFPLGPQIHPPDSEEAARVAGLLKERDALFWQNSELVVELRTIEAILGTADHSAAIDDEGQLGAHISAKLALLLLRHDALRAALTPFAQEWKFMQDNPQLANGVVRNNKALETAWALLAEPQPVGATPDTIESYFVRQSDWSARTFGHGTRTQGIVEHIRKELDEVLASPHDLEEWIDLTMLAMDGFWRHGGDPREILKHLNAKQAKNFARKWKTPTDGHAVEHVREATPDPAIRTDEGKEEAE